MIKKVNVLTQGRPITALSIMIRSDLIGVDMETEDIKKIILQKGSVNEVLKDGTTVSLNLSNYDEPDMYAKVLAERNAAKAEAAAKELEVAKEKEVIKQKEEAKKAAIEAAKKSATQSQVKTEVKTTPVVTETKVEAKATTTVKDDAVVAAAREKLEKSTKNNKK